MSRLFSAILISSCLHGCGGTPTTPAATTIIASSGSNESSLIVSPILDPTHPRPKELIHCKGTIAVTQGKTPLSPPHLEIRRKNFCYNQARIRLKTSLDGKSTEFEGDIAAPRDPGHYEIVVCMQFEVPTVTQTSASRKAEISQLVSKPVAVEVVKP